MSRQNEIELLSLHEEMARRKRYRKINEYYPAKGPLRRDLYPKHMQFFFAGAKYTERLFMAANRVGKTEGAGGYEIACHLTGNYPEWWNGKRFDRPIDAWAAGDTKETVRDIIQTKLMGEPHDIGSGLIPKDLIADYSRKSGISNSVDTVFVKHKSGGISKLSFKSYDQARISFQGTKKDVIWLDEEPPLDVYTECLLRTTDTSASNDGNGIMMLTFTPLMGMSETVMAFLPNGQVKDAQKGSKFVVMATWDDVAHLSKETKEKLWNSIPPFQRDARSKGVPALGSGAIYPVPESDFIVEPFDIPDHWPRGYSLDVGWNRTAALWGALDRENDVLYLYAEHYRSQAEPSIHAEAIKARGQWIPGVIDPASNGRSQKDGNQLIEDYKSLGLDLENAVNTVEAGIYQVWQRLSTGRMKVFSSLSNWRYEFRLYRRDEKGRIVKENDHLMDDTRYLTVSGIARMKPKPMDKKEEKDIFYGSDSGSWMGS